MAKEREVSVLIFAQSWKNDYMADCIVQWNSHGERWVIFGMCWISDDSEIFSGYIKEDLQICRCEYEKEF